MKVKCPHCGSINILNIYSGDSIEEDISCGINIVEYNCECEDCFESFDCMIHYAISDVVYK
jgi:hypothetical protein